MLSLFVLVKQKKMWFDWKQNKHNIFKVWTHQVHHWLFEVYGYCEFDAWMGFKQVSGEGYGMLEK